MPCALCRHLTIKLKASTSTTILIRKTLPLKITSKGYRRIKKEVEERARDKKKIKFIRVRREFLRERNLLIAPESFLMSTDLHTSPKLTKDPCTQQADQEQKAESKEMTSWTRDRIKRFTKKIKVMMRLLDLLWESRGIQEPEVQIFLGIYKRNVLYYFQFFKANATTICCNWIFYWN